MKVLNNKDHIKVDYFGVLYNEMTCFVSGVHMNQFTENGVAVLSHLMRVCHYVNHKDEELQCIALGHELFSIPNSATIHELTTLGMTNRIINGITLLTKDKATSDSDYLNKIAQHPDSLMVGYLCYRDHYLSCKPNSSEAIRLSNIVKGLYTHLNRVYSSSYATIL
jgi:hypothetical protein